MTSHELETQRLRLRLFTPDDVEDFYRILGDPEVRRFMADGEEFSKEDTLAVIERFISTYKERGFGRWAVVHKEHGKLIGYCGLIVLREAVGVELAYLLASEYWGRGIATEAARACLRYGFEELRCERIAAISIVENMASKRVMEHLGMTYVENLPYFGHDCFHYSISRDAFRFDDSPYTAREVSPYDEARSDETQSRFSQTP